jgi:hypothetical protein
MQKFWNAVVVSIKRMEQNQSSMHCSPSKQPEDFLKSRYVGILQEQEKEHQGESFVRVPLLVSHLIYMVSAHHQSSW